MTRRTLAAALTMVLATAGLVVSVVAGTLAAPPRSGPGADLRAPGPGRDPVVAGRGTMEPVRDQAQPGREGRTAREAAKADEIAVTAVCELLRDAASALALMHSRRLVHRDVSPRNLWCSPDGHGKLIDFGTLVAVGPQTRIAGTPAFVLAGPGARRASGS